MMFDSCDILYFCRGNLEKEVQQLSNKIENLELKWVINCLQFSINYHICRFLLCFQVILDSQASFSSRQRFNTFLSINEY